MKQVSQALQAYENRRLEEMNVKKKVVHYVKIKPQINQLVKAKFNKSGAFMIKSIIDKQVIDTTKKY